MITKNATVSTNRIQLRITRHVDDDPSWPDSILIDVSSFDRGVSAMLHLSVDDAKALIDALSETCEEEVTA